METRVAEKTRQTNLELLRIISMIMIVTLHFLRHGGILDHVPFLSPGYYGAWFIEGIAYVSANCYVLISGYFLINSKFKLKKLIILLEEVFFYSAVIYIIFIAFGLHPVSIKEAITAFLPTLSSEYWFVTIYVGMFVLSPFINYSIKAMTKRQMTVCILILVALFTIWPNLFFYSVGLNFGGGLGVVWFIVLYYIAAYLKLYYKPSFQTKKLFLIYSIAAILVPLSRFAIALLAKTQLVKYINSNIIMNQSGIFYSYNSILVLFASITLFILFLNITIKNKIINKIILFFSSLTFGVYLIHENPLITNALWSFVNPTAYLSKWYFPFFIVFVIAVIYVACSLIDYIRTLLFHKINSGKWLEKLCVRLESRFNKIVLWVEHFTGEKE